MTTSIELLINVESRRSREALPAILDYCQREGLEFSKITRLTKNDDLGRTIGAIKRRQPKLLIVGGGDGTISDVVDHMVDSKINIGLIPLGTTNNFARSLNLPLDPLAAIAVIQNRTAKPVDLGKVRHDYFANVTGIGLSALIAKNITNQRKKFWGRAAYGIQGLQELIRHKPFRVVIEDKDSELSMHFETHQLIVANGRFHAGKEIAKQAKVDNHELVIFRLGGKSKLSFMWHTLDFYLGRRKSIRHASYVIGRDIKIHTSSPQSVELDGEVKFKTPLDISVAKKAIKIHY